MVQQGKILKHKVSRNGISNEEKANAIAQISKLANAKKVQGFNITGIIVDLSTAMSPLPDHSVHFL